MTECTKCHAPIVYLWGKWRHDTPAHDRGCRAASYVEDIGHNEDIPRNWVATAPRGTKRPTETEATEAAVKRLEERAELERTIRESRTTATRSGKGVIIYHRMFANENFEQTAQILVRLIAEVQEAHPDVPRDMVLEIDEHRNEAGGLDRDAFEIVKDFGMTQLMPYLTSFTTPIYKITNPKGQRNDPPHTLTITHPKGE